MIWDEIQKIKDVIDHRLPAGTIIPEHTATQHYYRYTPTNELLASVTTKSSILKGDGLKEWAVNQAIIHIKSVLSPGSVVPEFDQYEEIFIKAKTTHVEIFEDAGDIGTKIHAGIEKYLNQWISDKQRPQNILDFIPNEKDIRIVSAVRACETFCKENYILPIHSELLVASPKHKVAGTLDFLALKGKILEKGDVNCTHELWDRTMRQECIHCGMKIKYELALIDWKSSNSIQKKEYIMQVGTYWECLKELVGLRPKNITIVQLDKKNGSYKTESVDKNKRKKAFEAYSHLIKVYDWSVSSDAKFESEQKILQI